MGVVFQSMHNFICNVLKNKIVVETIFTTFFCFSWKFLQRHGFNNKVSQCRVANHIKTSIQCCQFENLNFQCSFFYN